MRDQVILWVLFGYSIATPLTEYPIAIPLTNYPMGASFEAAIPLTNYPMTAISYKPFPYNQTPPIDISEVPIEFLGPRIRYKGILKLTIDHPKGKLDGSWVRYNPRGDNLTKIDITIHNYPPDKNLIIFAYFHFPFLDDSAMGGLDKFIGRINFIGDGQYATEVFLDFRPYSANDCKGIWFPNYWEDWDEEMNNAAVYYGQMPEVFPEENILNPINSFSEIPKNVSNPIAYFGIYDTTVPWNWQQVGIFDIRQLWEDRAVFDVCLNAEWPYSPYYNV